MAKTDNGKGASKSVSSEEHEAARKAAQARKKANRKSKGLHAETYFAGRQADIQARRDRAREARERREDAQARKDQLKRQALLALDDPTLGALEAGSPAALMALKVIELYPTVQTHGEGRVRAAIQAARDEVRKDFPCREGALDKGAHVARQALRLAGDQVFGREAVTV